MILLHHIFPGKVHQLLIHSQNNNRKASDERQQTMLIEEDQQHQDQNPLKTWIKDQ